MNSLTASSVMKFKDGDERLLWRDGLNTRELARLLGLPVGIDEGMLAIGEGGIVFTTANKVEFVLTHSADGNIYEAVTDADMTGVDDR